jgi:hypothetical protein
MDDESETAALLAAIPGGVELLSIAHASLGDAEIVSLHLTRKGPSTLEVSLPWTDDGVVATFVLSDWIDVQINGFSHQNVVGGLIVRRAGERKVHLMELGVGLTPGELELEFEPCFGAYGTIRATVTRIELCATKPN